MKKLDAALVSHIANDREENNWDSEGTASLEEIVGISVFNRPKFLQLYSGDVDNTNNVPQILYFSDTIAKDRNKFTDAFFILVRDNNQIRLDNIGTRITDILTEPFIPCSTFARLTSDSVNIGLIRLESDQDGAIKPQSFEKTLKFTILYTRRN